MSNTIDNQSFVEITNTDGQIQTTSTQQTTSEPVGGNLGKDAFMELLVTQMQYQDPLNPMDDTDYLAQLAQFSSLEQMQNLNNQFEQYNGHSMIGKYGYASYQNPNTNENEYIEGMVEGVKYMNGQTYLIIDDKDVALESVSLIEYAVAAEELAKVQQLQAGNAFSLIGYYAYGQTYNDETDTYEEIQGVVDQVSLEDGRFYLMIGGEKVDIAYLTEVLKVAPSETGDSE